MKVIIYANFHKQEVLSEKMVIIYENQDMQWNIQTCNGDDISLVSCQKGPTHACAWQIGPFWQDPLDMNIRGNHRWAERVYYE